MRRRIMAFVAIGWLLIARASAADPIEVWLDVDTATGSGDVDDGLAVIQTFRSPELRLRGISTVFGNAPLAKATPIACEIVSRFGPAEMPVHSGAASAEELGSESPAVQALAAALRESPLTILALGPVTNIATLVKRHPELNDRIRRIVIVAARREGQRFETDPRQKLPHRDFNFELDPAGMQVLLDSPIELVFAPWEVSSHVWLTRDDLKKLSATGGSGEWIAKTSEYWIKLWEATITDKGFNPFDTLAVGYLTHPQWIKSLPVAVRIEEQVDDRDPDARKPYLIVRPGDDQGRRATYCYEPLPEFKPLLLERLAGPGKTGN